MINGAASSGPHRVGQKASSRLARETGVQALVISIVAGIVGHGLADSL